MIHNWINTNYREIEGAKWSFQAGWFECFVFIVSKQTLTLVIDRSP